MVEVIFLFLKLNHSYFISKLNILRKIIHDLCLLADNNLKDACTLCID